MLPLPQFRVCVGTAGNSPSLATPDQAILGRQLYPRLSPKLFLVRSDVGLASLVLRLDEIRIVPDAPDPGIRPCPDWIVGVAVPGTAFAADKMACHFRHWHALGQPQDLGIEIEVALRPAIASVDL